VSVFLTDVMQFTRPRLVATVLLTVVAGAWCAGAARPDMRILGQTLGATALIIVSAIAANQVIEREGDRRMRRTANRPLAAGRWPVSAGIGHSGMTLIAGCGWLASRGLYGPLFWGAACWAVYVGGYTPLKRRSVWQTAVGAFAGAAPVFIGASVNGGAAHPVAVLLFLTMAFWQAPHTMAIAWLYRDDYRQAGIRVAGVVDPSGRSSGWIALTGAVATCAAAVSLAFFSERTVAVAFAALVLGAAFGVFAATFLRRRDNTSARRLLASSLVFLPLFLLALCWGVR